MLYIDALKSLSTYETQIEEVLPLVKFIEYRNLLIDFNIEYLNGGLIVRYEYYEGDMITSGHFVAIYFDSDNNINIFDSLALILTEKNDYVDMKHRHHMRQLIDYLKGLNYTILINRHRYQQLNDSIQTCGRYCAIVLKLKININNFEIYFKNLKNSYFKKNISNDEIITIITLLM